MPIDVTRAGRLFVTVKAAPWIPVEEIRVYVNGQLVLWQDVRAFFENLDPFGVQAGSLPQLSIKLDSLIHTSGDAWLVVEAGMSQDPQCGTLAPSANPRPCVKDADDDGLPDLLNEDIPTRPDPTDSRFDLEAIAPGVWPTAFSNPFLLNLDGGDWTAPGL